jgi:nitrate/nitrite transporter NarK
MDLFRSERQAGVWQTFVTLGVVYGSLMLLGALTVRIPPPNWRPTGWTLRPAPGGLISAHDVHANTAIRTPQFLLLWVMLCLNVTAGIGILGKASDMLQDMFAVDKQAGATFVILLSFANMGGRFLWSTLSDGLGRKRTYALYFGLGALLYALLPSLAHTGAYHPFVAVCLLIMTMYGGGFATIPAYLRDLFGTMHVSAIHGRLLTAWSLAGVLGPVLLTRWAERQKAAGVPSANSYSQVLYFLSALLLVGFVANLCITPVAPRHHHPTQG